MKLKQAACVGSSVDDGGAGAAARLERRERRVKTGLRRIVERWLRALLRSGAHEQRTRRLDGAEGRCGVVLLRFCPRLCLRFLFVYLPLLLGCVFELVQSELG